MQQEHLPGTNAVGPVINRRLALTVGAAAAGAIALPVLVGPDAAAAGRPANAALATRPSRRPLVLADAAGARAHLVLPASAAPEVLQAAQELITNTELATGHPLPIGDGPGVPIRLDAAARDARPDLPSDLGAQEFVIDVTASGVDVVGGSPLGTLFGVYALLEQADFRWIMPGPAGTDLPRSAVVAVPQGVTRQAPYFSHRAIQSLDQYPPAAAYPGVNRTEGRQWTQRMRMDNVNVGAHGIPLFPAATRQSNPELFIKIDGVVQNQLDVTLPEVLDRAVEAARRLLIANPSLEYLSMGPNDGAGFGVTDWDVPGRIDPLNGELIVTDRLVKFYNLLLDRLSPDYPDIKVAFYAYYTYLEPPIRERPNPRLVPLIAAIAVSRRTTTKDPNGWERRYMLRVAREWRQLGVQVTYRGYLGNLADPSMPFYAGRQFAIEIPEMAEAGLSGPIRVENIQGWGYGAPTYYLAAKLFWNPTQDPGAVLNDYFRRAYGPAATAMRAFFDMLAQRDRQVDFTAGGIWDGPKILPARLLVELDSTLQRAERVAARLTGKPYTQRITVTRKAFDAGTALAAAQRELLATDYQQANADYARASTAFDAAATHTPAAVLPFTTLYQTRYGGDSLKSAVVATTAPNTLLVHTPETWRALIDPPGAAEQDGVFLADASLDHWTTLHSADLTWSAQGLRYYKGRAWYACDVKVPTPPAGQDVKLWLGITDEAAQVWLNGNELPALVGPRGLWVSQFLATAALRPGRNRLVVKITNVILDELGTGGLLSRSLFYATPAVAALPASLAPATGAPAPSTARLQGARLGGRGFDLPDRWELMLLNPVNNAARLALYDPRIGSQHWRTHSVSGGFPRQGLGYYTGSAVIRTTVRGGSRLRSGRYQLVIPAVDGAARAWIDGTELPRVSGTPGGVWRFDVPRHVGSQPSVTIAFDGGAATSDRRGIAGPIRFVRC